MTSQISRAGLALFLFAVAACSGTDPVEETATAEDALACRRCPTNEIAFTRATGCQNDGSVEFCVPTSDVALQQRIALIAPTVRYVGSAGRARCDIATERLGMLPLEPAPSASCNAGGAMRARTWAQVCRIASEPAIRAVVPTFYE